MKLPHFVLAMLCASAIAAETPRIAFIPKGGTNDYWKAAHAGAAKAALEARSHGEPVEIVLHTPNGVTPAEQTEAQKALLAQVVKDGYSGILLAAAHTVALRDAVGEAAAAKIPVALFDSGMNSDAPLTLVATNNYKAGRKAALHLGEKLHGKGKIVVLRYRRGVSSTEARENGFLDTLKSQFPGLEVASASEYAGGSVETARKAALALLEKHGADIDGVFCSNGGLALGFAGALHERGVPPGKLVVVGFDTGPEIMAELKSGYLSAVVVQDPFSMGYQGVKALLAARQGRAVEKLIETNAVVVIGANLSDPQIDELLHPPFDKYLK